MNNDVVESSLSSTSPLQVQPSLARNSFFRRAIKGLLSLGAVGALMTPRNAEASGNCQNLCEGEFNFRCWFQQNVPIHISYECSAGSGYEFNAFADLGNVGLVGYIDFQGFSSGCMTFDSSTCNVSSC